MLYGSCIKGCCVSEQEVAATKTILCLFALREDPFSKRRSLPLTVYLTVETREGRLRNRRRGSLAAHLVPSVEQEASSWRGVTSNRFIHLELCVCLSLPPFIVVFSRLFLSFPQCGVVWLSDRLHSASLYKSKVHELLYAGLLRPSQAEVFFIFTPATHSVSSGSVALCTKIATHRDSLKRMIIDNSDVKYCSSFFYLLHFVLLALQVIN